MAITRKSSEIPSIDDPILNSALMSAEPWRFDIEKYLRELKYPLGDQSLSTFDELIGKFNVSRLPDYANVTRPFVGHVIFTRPSLYVDTMDNTSPPYSSSMPDQSPNPGSNYRELLRNQKTAAIAGNPYGIKLLQTLSDIKNGVTNSNYYMPLFSARAMSYAVNDVELKTVDKGQTFYGNSVKYGNYSHDHKSGGTVSIDFRNDGYWSILTAAYLWMSYIHIVSHSETIKPSLIYQENAILDYCGSIYYLVTETDMRTLIYWEKLTGVFPIKAPFSLFSYTDSIQVEDKIPVEFNYGARSEPKDIQVLLDLNYLSGITPTIPADPSPEAAKASFTRFDNWNGVIGMWRDAYSSGPVITFRPGVDRRGNRYFLNWLR